MNISLIDSCLDGLNRVVKGVAISALMLLTATDLMAQCTPTVTPSGATDLCSGQSVTLTSSAGASYLWSNGATTQSIVASTAGAYVVTVDNGAGCSAASIPVYVTVYFGVPQRPSIVTGQSTVCPGETFRYTINRARRAVNYTWTLPAGATSGGLSTVTTTDTVLDVTFDPAFTGGVVMTVVANNGCGSSPVRNKSLYRRNAQRPASIDGPDYTCPGGTYQFNVPPQFGIDSWTWTVPTGASITGQGNDTVSITFPAGFLSGTISVTATNGCSTSAARSVIKSAYVPNPTTISGPTSGVCGSTETYTCTAMPGATSYQWTAPFGSTVISGQGTTTATIQFWGSLSSAFVRVASVNVCGSRGSRFLAVSGNVNITTQPSDITGCDGGQAYFVVGADGSSNLYQWKKNGVSLANGGNISGANTDSLVINPVSAADAGSYTCEVRNFCSGPITSSAGVLTIGTILPAPAGPISGIDVACEGTTGQAFSVPPVPGATNYIWTAYHGATIASGQGTNSITVDFGPSTFSGYYIDVRVENACGISDSTKKWVRRSISVPTFLTVPTVVCPGQTGVVYEVDTVSGALSYNWNVTGGTIVTGQGTTSITVDFGSGFTTGQVCVSATNQCVTTADRCENLLSSPATPGSIQGASNNVCNSTQSYSINPVLGATSYTWSVGSGATIVSGQGTNSISVDFGPSYVTGNVSVTAQNGCGTSAPKVKQVNAFPAKIPSITGNAGPCANSAGNIYSVSPVTGATSYTWTVFTGATIAAGQGTTSITVDFGANDGIISVAPVNACGTGFSTNLRIIFTCRIAGTTQLVQMATYPNPANEVVYVKSPETASSVQKIMVSDMTGKVLYSVSNPVAGSDGVYDLDINSLKPGMYIIEMQAGSERMTSKFIKE